MGMAAMQQQVANRNGRDLGWEMAHAAVTQRPPISLYTIAPRTGGFAYAVGVWDLSIIQGPFPVAPCQTNRFSLCVSVAVRRLVQEAVLSSPTGVARLTDMMQEREVIRNEALLLLAALTRANEEMKKLVVFEGAFERLFALVRPLTPPAF
jgi:hypothetical protein